jgi:hypothetical protein
MPMSIRTFEETTIQFPPSDLIAFDRWLSAIPVTSTTGWRWRKRGWIKTVNISGRIYISRQEIISFEERAAAGEFAKTHPTPKREAADE